MFKPAALFIGLRYTRAKRRNNFISLISLVSLTGIALGVMVLITVLSVMNGFDGEIKKRVFSMIPAMTVSSREGSVSNWRELQSIMKQFSYVQASAPYVAGEVLLNNGGTVQPALVSGIMPNQEEKITKLSQKIIGGALSNLQAGQFGIVLGENLASLLNVSVGDKVTVVTPQVSLSPAGVLPRYKRFTVVGIFSAGTGFGFDRGMGFIHLNDAQKLLGLGNQVTGLHLSINNVYKAPLLAQDMITRLTQSASITTWADQFGEFFHAVQLEKNIMFIILLLIIGVAAFNLVATLMMVVNEKEADIAILRTCGATPRMIMAIFILQGGIIGVLGTLVGLLAGLLLASHVTQIVHWIEQVFHVQFLSSNIYFVNYLPSEIAVGDVVKICVASLLLSLIATIYPAWRAAKMDPVESLRYE